MAQFDVYYNNNYYWVYGNRKYSVVALNRWTPATAATATYPRLTTSSGSNNFRNSTYWLYSDNYFTLNRVQLTYHLPAMKFWKGIQLYVRGNNLFTISETKKLLHGFTAIDEKIANKLSTCLGGSIDFWLQLQKLFDVYSEKVKEIECARWLKELPVKELQKNGWIQKNQDLLEECLRFFNVPDVWSWRKKYSDITALALFRKSTKFQSNPASIATWIRQGELQAEKLPLKKWNPDLFKASLDEIKKFTRQKDPFSFIQKLRTICSECGIALAIIPTSEGCSASGAAKFLDNGCGLIIMSFRYGTDDHFWFTFFHEAGHLLLHGERDTFVDEDIEKPSVENDEQQANDFALDVLLPGNLKNELQQLKVSDATIRSLANKAGVSLGIIVGQLQYFGKIKPNYYNGFKRRYDKETLFKKLG